MIELKFGEYLRDAKFSGWLKFSYSVADPDVKTGYHKNRFLIVKH